MASDRVGDAGTILIVIRGNSGSGKSSVAREVRDRYGRGCALIEQDYLRRIVLRERDRPGGIAPRLIATNVEFSLNHGYHVVLEGILAAARYADVIGDLLVRHRGRTAVFYLDVSLDETLHRHTTRPQVNDFTADEMRSWYQPRDVLGCPGEVVVPESSSLDETVDLIVATSGLIANESPLGHPDDVIRRSHVSR